MRTPFGLSLSKPIRTPFGLSLSKPMRTPFGLSLSKPSRNPFGLSLSKPLHALRQAQCERFACEPYDLIRESPRAREPEHLIH